MELPSILNWALDGRGRLSQRGYFVQPKSSSEVTEELEDLGSPIGAFLRDCCQIAKWKSVEVEELYAKWEMWCRRCGRDWPGTIQTFGRDLRAAVPGLKVSHPRNGEGRRRIYEGVGLKPEEARKV
jgi:putative DNA primase/helicase